MKLYPKNYYCFGCGAHGDVIDLVQAVFNEKPVDAAKRINTDFVSTLKSASIREMKATD